MNLYIFNETRRGAVYGVRTYIRELTAALKRSDMEISVVNLISDRPHIQTEEADGIRQWYFPAPISEQRSLSDREQRELYHRNAACLLRLYIKDTTGLIFHLNFEEGIMHEDELWTPVVLYQAEKMVISDIEFYYYRQNNESVMHNTRLFRRLDSLFRVTDRLMEWASRFDFSGEDKELKSWWYATVFRLYAHAFTLRSIVKDSSYSLPAHHLDRFRQERRQMIPAAQQRCGEYFRDAETGMKKYADWLTSSWIASADNQINPREKRMLIYNIPTGKELLLKREDVPADWVITTDRKYFQQAHVVVFCLPDLQQELEHDLDKPEGQIWVSCYSESEKEHPLINDLEIRELFDLFICYRPDETFAVGLRVIFGHFQ